MAPVASVVDNPAEALLAELTDAAYRVALKHGLRGAFIDVELDLWTALRAVLREELLLADPAAPTECVRASEVQPLTVGCWEQLPCRV